MDYLLKTLGPDGQPRSKAFNWQQNCSKLYDLLRGFATGALADGVVCQKEAEAFRALLATADQEFRATKPFSFIISRVESIFSDGRIDEEEREELRQIFEDLSLETTKGEEDSPCEMIYTMPEPVMVFMGSVFTVTGKFAMGTRAKVVEAIQAAGGGFAPGLSKKTTFLVVGSFVSRDWKHSDLGLKIEKALGYGVPVVRESSLLRVLGG